MFPLRFHFQPPLIFFFFLLFIIDAASFAFIAYVYLPLLTLIYIFELSFFSFIIRH